MNVEGRRVSFKGEYTTIHVSGDIELVPQKEGFVKETGDGIMHKREESSEDEKSDDLADLYVNDDDSEESADAVVPGAQNDISEVRGGRLKKVDSLDGVYEKDDGHTPGHVSIPL